MKRYVIVSACIFTLAFSFSPAYAEITSNLKLGDQNPQVSVLQKFLNKVGHIVSIKGPGSLGQETNVFGQLTASAVKSFQCAFGIVCSGTSNTTGFGVVGIKTRSFINNFLSLGGKMSLSDASGSSTDIYITDNSSGSSTGADCADGHSATWFNTSSSWGASAGQIGPGVTVHLCGTITNNLTVQGSGTSGSPITILFENGAKMSKAAWSGTIINVSSQNYITIDGGATGVIGGYTGNPSLVNGVIESTDNGTNLGHKLDATGILGNNSTHIIVKNLVIRNLYVRVSGSDTLAYGSGVSSQYGASDWLIDNMILSDMLAGTWLGYGAGTVNYEVSRVTAYNINWGGAAGDNNSSASLTGLSVHDNYYHDFINWDQPSNQFHHDGFYAWAESGGTLNGVKMYNNVIGPNYSVGDINNSTAGLFVSGTTATGNMLIYNNLFLGNMSGGGPACGFIFLSPGNGAVARVYNNTFIGATGWTDAVQIRGSNGGTETFDVKNNIAVTTMTMINVLYNSSPSVVLTSDNNIIYNSADGFGFSSNGSSAFLSLSQWKALGYDAHSTSTNPNLDANYKPQSGSVAIDAGASLSSYLTTDILGTARPQGSGWDIGAYEITGVSAPSSYNITASAGTGGTISPSGTVSVTSGGNQTFTIASSTGYHIATTTVDGSIVSLTNSTYTFSNVTTTHTIAATFLTNPDITAPSVPISLATSSVSQTGITISWATSTDNVGVVGYKIYRGGVQVGTSTVTNYSDTGLTASSTYSYSVAAYDLAGNTSAQSTTLSVKTNATPVITYTLNVSKSGTGGGTVTGGTISCGSTCAQSGIASGTAVTLSAVADGSSSFSGWSGACSGTGTCAVTLTSDLSVSAAFTANVVVTPPVSNPPSGGGGGGGGGGYSPPLVSPVPVPVSSSSDKTAPSVPTKLTFSNITQTTATINWKASTDNVGVGGYYIFRNGIRIATTASTTYINSSLATSTTYSYAIASFDFNGNVSAKSSPLLVVTNKFKFGDKAKVITSKVNIRKTAGGKLVGYQYLGKVGVIIGSSTYSGGYTWWNVDYTSGADGWTAQDFLK